MENLIAEIFENSISPDKLSDLPSSAGLVLFTDNQNLPILLLSAANIRRVAKTKLAEQSDPSTGLRAGITKKADLKSITAKIYYKTCPCKFRLSIEHYKAIKLIFPSNYKDYIAFVYPWFIEVDLNEKIPFFSITRKPSFEDMEEVLGPFPSQKSASTFLNTLRDTFKLCKGDYVNSRGCPYFQMDACCGICVNKITSDEYKNIINQAFDAGAEPAKTIENLQSDMQTASKELNFEKAAELKRKIEKLSALNRQTYPHTNLSSVCTYSKSSAKISVQHSQTNRRSEKIGVGAYRWTADLEKLKIVHVDKAGKIKIEGSKTKKQTLAVFVMNFSRIIDMGDFLSDDKNKICDEIQNVLNKLNDPQQSCDAETLEKFSIISYFLYRSKPSGLWLSTSDQFDKDKLMDIKDI